MPRLRHSATVTAALLVAAGAAGCGGERSSPVVVRVGTVAIDRATIDHWTRAIGLGSAVGGASGRSGATPRTKALDFLISANWAIGAAAERGLRIAGVEIARGLRERVAAAHSRPAEFAEELAATGQTLADVKLEVEAALAAKTLREFIFRKALPVTNAQVAAYYEHHLQSFRIPDRRLVDLIEYIHGYAHAVALGRQLGSGERFTRRGMRELVPRQTPNQDAHQENGRMVQAIFATPPGQVGGPVIFHGAWVLLVVRKLVPAAMKPLAAVRAEITERLSSERRQLALASFLLIYRREWIAKTRCHAGFIVQRCSEYRGPLTEEGDPLAAD